MIVPVVEAAKRDLLLKADSEGLAHIRELALVRRLIGIIPSESGAKRTISTQCSIMGMKGTRFGQRPLTARRQTRQTSKTSLA
jgi:hypothetical protein